jgi:hypothetical protein
MLALAAMCAIVSPLSFCMALVLIIALPSMVILGVVILLEFVVTGDTDFGERIVKFVTEYVDWWMNLFGRLFDASEGIVKKLGGFE